MKIFLRNRSNNCIRRFFVNLFTLSSLALLISGCYTARIKDPEQTFEAFIQAVNSDSKQKAISYILPQSITVVMPDSEAQFAWFEKLKFDTNISKPKIKRIEWLKRGFMVKVIYSYTGHLNEDYLIMTFDKNKWWINLTESSQPTGYSSMPAFVPSRFTGN